MPTVSFVLAVHREQGYLRECLGSVLGQSFTDLEVVAVDDASPDHAPEILYELAAKDSRLKVRHLDQRVGPGQARNLALDEVTGDYLWFIETTDHLPAGALAKAAERLASADPDVLVVADERTSASGGTGRGPYAHLIAGARARKLFWIGQRSLASLAPDSGNKLIRRELVNRLELRFGPGYHDELTVTYPAMLATDRIALLDRVSYCRREPYRRSQKRGAYGSPFDVFGQYDEVFAFVERAGGQLAERRSLLFTGMLRHYFTLLDHLDERDRPAFFSRMTESYRAHERSDDQLPGSRLTALRFALVKRGSYAAFRALTEVAERRHDVRDLMGVVSKRRQQVARRRRQRSLERYYRAQLREPLDPNLAVYAAYWYRGYACNPRAIYEKARELVPSVHGVWVVDKKAAAAMPSDVPYVISGTRRYYETIARATYLVNNVNFPNHLVKRDGSVHLQTHHGTPLKTMGMDLKEAPGAGTRMNFDALLRRCARWDYSISQNAFSTEVWERVYPTGYTSLEVGYPRNDVLVNAIADDVRKTRDELGIRPEQRAVLYAPTHRDYHKGFVPVLDLAHLADELGPEFVILARLHYFYDADEHLADLRRSGRVLDVARHPSVEQLCLAADVLVTDYSSIMFDYAVLDRPIVIYAPDWEVYRALRGTYFDLVAEPPGAVTRTQDELVQVLRSGEVGDERATQARASFRARFCALEDGRAAERVVTRLWPSARTNDHISARRPSPG